MNRIVHVSYFDPDYPTSGLTATGLTRAPSRTSILTASDVSRSLQTALMLWVLAIWYVRTAIKPKALNVTHTL
jgi:hypothetical protein